MVRLEKNCLKQCNADGERSVYGGRLNFSWYCIESRSVYALTKDKTESMKYFILFSLMLISSVTYSCSCIPLGKMDEKQYNRYDLIIKGKIIQLEEKGFTRIIYIKVDTYFKGKLDTTTIQVASPNQSGMCGIFPKIGEEWLVFGYKEGNGFTTSLCTRSKSLNPDKWNFKKNEIEDDLKFLEGKLETTVVNKSLSANGTGRWRNGPNVNFL
jgi:hypothetical protein